MKIVKFKGGLGNQLFQYAFIRNLQEKYKCEDVKGDLFYFEDLLNDEVRKPRIEKLNVKVNWATKDDVKKATLFNRPSKPLSVHYKAVLYFEKTFNKNYFFEPNRAYTDISKIVNKTYFDGYWQSWKYVECIKDQLREELTPSFELSNKTKDAIAKIQTENAVFISVRRGDYLSNKKVINHFGDFSEDYYKRGVEYIKSKVNNPIFYIFSNDIKWVEDNIDFGTEVIYRREEDQVSDVEELFIMGACKHAIIVNSTFHWWGAWMIDNPEKIVIAPEDWFVDGKPIDIVPDKWIKLKR